MTRGLGGWRETDTAEKNNVEMNVNGYSRHQNPEMSSIVSIGDSFSSLLRRISNEREREQRLQACSDLRRLILEANDFKVRFLDCDHMKISDDLRFRP